MSGGGFQKGLPTRSEKVEGGNFVPVDIKGSKRTRPQLRGDLVEGLVDWCPDGTYAIYAGFPTDPNVPNNVIQMWYYNAINNTLTDITPTVDARGVSLLASDPNPLSVQFLAVKFAPFYSPAAGGYFCFILVRVAANLATAASTQIWIYNGGTNPLTVPAPGGALAPFVLTNGVVNTWDGANNSSYFCLPNWDGATPPTPPWAAWTYLADEFNVGIMRDVGFSWGGDPLAAANAQQIPYGIVVGDGPAYWGDGAGGIPIGAGAGYPVSLANVYCIQFSDGLGITDRFVPYRSLEYVETNYATFPQGASGTTATSHINKVTMFRKGLAVITYDTNNYLNQVWEATGNQAVTFVREAGLTPTQFGRIRRASDAVPGAVTNGMTFTEIRGRPTDLRVTTPTWAAPPAPLPDTTRATRPIYTDLTWGPNMNALWVVGRDGRIISVTNRKWIFQNPSDTTFTTSQEIFPDATTVHTGIQWSGDGIGYLLTSKSFNSDPARSNQVPTLENVSDAFVRNLITYYSSPIGYQIFTLNESKVTGFPFTTLNQFGQEHYRYAWHPFSRYAIFSIYGGLEKFDQDVFVDMQGSLSATVNVPQPLNIRVQDGNGATLADVVTDGTGLNRLCVDASLALASTPDVPVFVQDEGQMVLEEFSPADSTVTGWSTADETVWLTAVTDWSQTTGVTSLGAATATLVFRHPILISRIGLQGTFVGLSISVVDVTGLEWAKPYNIDSDGADTGNFHPILARGINIAVTDASALYEMAVFKTHEVKVNSPGADMPVQVQAQQIVSLDEVDTVNSDLIGDTAGTIVDLFDRDYSTGVTFGGARYDGVDIALKSPLLISRVTVASATASIPDTLVITVFDVTNTAHVMYDGTSYNATGNDVYGIDTDNFKQQPGLVKIAGGGSPIVAKRIKITDDIVGGHTGGPWSIDEITLFKTIETKAYVYNEPAEPIFVQDDQQIIEDEVWWENAATTGSVLPVTFIEPAKSMLRKVPSGLGLTFSYNAGTATSLYLPFNSPHLVDRVVLRGGNIGFPIDDLNVDLELGFDDTNTPIYKRLVTGFDGYYYDSGNLDTPVVATGILLTDGRTVTSDAYDIFQLSIFKAFETKVGNATSYLPLQVQAEQQVVMSEIASVSGTGDLASNLYLNNLFDKAVSANKVVYAATESGTIVTTLTHPLMLSRAVLTGSFGAGDVISVAYTTASGSVTVIDVTVPVGGLTILDSGNVPDEVVTVITIDVDATTGAGGSIDELALFKVVETKDGSSWTSTMVMVNDTGSGLVENAAPLLGDAIGPTAPPTFTVPADLSGHGVRVTAKQVNLEIEITTGTGVTTIKGFVDWYWSPDNSTLWYYMASQKIDDTAGGDGSGNPNPTGFNAAEDTSFQNLAMPENGIGKWINIVVRNTDADNDFTVSNARIVQR